MKETQQMKFRNLPERDQNLSNTYLKLNDKDQVKGVFRGDVEEFFVTWENGKSRECAPDDDGAKFRFRVNFVTKENGSLTAKIWEGGQIVYNQLRDLNESFDLERTVVTVKRNGTGKDTTYSVLPAGKDFKVSDEMERQLANVKLHDLEPVSRADEPAKAALFEESAPF